MNMTPQTKKYLVIGGVAIASLFLYKSVMPKTDTSGSTIDPTGNGSIPAGGNSSYPGYVFNAKNVANKLYLAMKDMGTDEEAIINALTPVSVSQFTEVMKAFGTRTYNRTTGNQYAVWGFDLPFLPLNVWLKEELSSKRYNHLALKFPQLK